MNTFRQQAEESLEMIDMEKAKERVDKILGTPALKSEDLEIVTRTGRKPRSDKGVPKARKPAAQSVDMRKLRDAISEYLVAGVVAQEAINRRDAAEKTLNEMMGLDNDPR